MNCAIPILTTISRHSQVMETDKFFVHGTELDGVMHIIRKRAEDSRGSFSRVFCAETFASFGWHKSLCQINHSYSQQVGTVRGLHFQRRPYSEHKLVSVLKGRIWDVAVDLREDSPTFSRWISRELSSARGDALLIPPGFAHGFQTLEPNVELIYFHDEPYKKDYEGRVNPLDRELAIKWPMPIDVISDLDRLSPSLADMPAGLMQ